MLSRETKRKIAKIFLPPLAFIVLWILYGLTRHRFFVSEIIHKDNVIGAFWHGELLMLPFLYRYMAKILSKQRHKGCYVISSQHFDSQMMVSVYQLFGLKTLHGSSSKGGARALANAIRLLNDGYDMGLSPDGPKGPYHSIAGGIIAMSSKTKKRVMPMRIVYSRYWELKSWDKFRIPKPFSRIDFYMLEGLVIDENMPMEAAKDLLKQALEKEL